MGEVIDLKAKIVDINKQLKKEMHEVSLTKLDVGNLKSQLKQKEEIHEVEKQDIKKKFDEEKLKSSQKYCKMVKDLESNNIEVKEVTSKKINSLLNIFSCAAN